MRKAGFILSLILGLLLGGCSGRSRNDANDIRSVSVAVPRPETPFSVMTCQAQVQEAAEITIGFKIPGEIDRVYVREGDEVKKGALLAHLNDTDYKLALSALEMQYELIKEEVGRVEKLYEQKSVTLNDYQKAMTGIKQLEIQLRLNRNKVSWASLYAPMSGVIRRVHFGPSEVVEAGFPVITMMDLSHVEVSVDVAESIYAGLENLTKVECRLPGAGVVKLKLVSVSPVPDGNRLYHLQLVPQGDEEGRLSAGMSVAVDFYFANTASEQTASSRYTLPAACVFWNENNESCVWVLEEGCLSARPVVLGEVNAKGDIVVIQGLNGDEQVVKAGVDRLHQGQKVKAVQPRSETNIGNLL